MVLVDDTAHDLHRLRCSRLHELTTLLCGIVALTGATVLIGWAISNKSLTSIFPGMTSMKVNTALELICLAVALHGLNKDTKAWRVPIAICLVLVGLMSVMTLAEYTFGINLGIDNFLIHDLQSPRFPGRNAPATNIALLVMVFAFTLLYLRRALTLAQLLLLVAASAPLATLGGYLYRAPGLYEHAPYPVIALNTSLALMLLCLGGLLARCEESLMAVVTSETAAGSLARVLLPAAFGLPFIAGLSVLAGERAGLYTAAFGSALLVAFCAILFSGAVCWGITLLWQTEGHRATAELARMRSETERERLLVSERAARVDAEKANRMKDEFLSVVSHELRTPINAILSWAEVLANKSADPDEVDEALKVIQRNARAQTRIVEDILDMSRIISGKLRLDVQCMDLANVIEVAMESVQPAADAKEIQLLKVLSSTAGPVKVDCARLQQILWNLLANAIKFTPKGGRVQVSLEGVDGCAEIRVSDNGEGITPEFLPCVFERFRQADSASTRRHGGLGLGLSIARELVELHGGTLQASSAGPGQGATFRVSLPLALRDTNTGISMQDSEEKLLPISH